MTKVSVYKIWWRDFSSPFRLKDAKSITMKNGKPATQGVCPTCGTKMFRIGKS